MFSELLKNTGLVSLVANLSRVSFGLLDALDIFLLGILIYAILKLIYETRSYPVIIGISTLLVFYSLATFLKLPLTRGALQSFLSVFIILLAVIFQSELRRFLTYFNLAPRIARRKLPSERV